MKEHDVSINITDRRDFYHQIWASPSRAISLGPGLSAGLLEGTDGLNLEQANKRRKRDYASFRSVLQGDHLGVEIACSAHFQLLSNYDLLKPDTLISARAPPSSSSLFQGLCIDDYFAISVEQKGQKKGTSTGRACFERAKQAYSHYKIMGSDDKDVIDAKEAKVIGGYINCGRSACREGNATLAAPIEKRLALAAITMEVVQLGSTTYQLHFSLVGGWTSIILFRHAFMGLLNCSFNLVSLQGYSSSEAKVMALPRRVASELCLVSVMAPIICSDLSADYFPEVFATDASNERGAVISAPLERNVSQGVWRCTKTKGSYTRLQTVEENMAQRLDMLSLLRSNRFL